MLRIGITSVEWKISFLQLNGMNMRIGFDPGDDLFTIGGRTDKAEIPERLRERMIRTFDVETLARIADGCSLTIYGEGIGSKIQKKGAKNFAPSDDGVVDFILFDVQHGEHWATRDEVSAVAREVGCREAPFVGFGSLDQAIMIARKGFNSYLQGADRLSEGLVIRPETERRGRWGQRIIAKVKTKDFE